MSTKTLRKRIALVAVAALGAGVLSVAPANAVGHALSDIVITPAAAGSIAATGVCVIDPKAKTGGDRAQFSTATVVAKGASLKFTSLLEDDATVTISGPAKWSAVSATADFAVNTTSTKITADGGAGGNATLTTSAAGTLTVTVKAASGAGVDVFGITVVESCTSTDTLVAANTLVNLANTDTAATGTDALVAADKAYGSVVWVNLKLRNAYKGAIADGILTASATNGALINFGADGGLASTAFVAGGSGDISLAVQQDTTTNPGKALSTVVTISFNGAQVATKSVTIFGTTASIIVSDLTIGTSAGTGTFKYVTKDNAGNQVDAPAALTNALAGVADGDIVSNVQATTASTPSAKGEGTFDCVAAGTASSGSEDTAIGYVTAALTVVKSATFKATCGKATVDTFTVSTDKASYSTGDIATVTITAKDDLGGLVADGTSVGADAVVSMGGMTQIGAVVPADDEFASGVKTYKFKVDTSTGSFVGTALVNADTDTTLKTVQYKIVSSDGGVSNADVLKAIVSLIASINKQIAALQKALLKK